MIMISFDVNEIEGSEDPVSGLGEHSQNKVEDAYIYINIING